MKTNPNMELALAEAALAAASGETPVGAVVVAPDGRIAVDYTLESHFERTREDIEHQIHWRLFPHEDSAPIENPGGKNGHGGARPSARRGGSSVRIPRLAKRPRAAKFKARSKAVRSLASSSMLAMPVSSRAAGRWRSRKR